MDLKRFREMLEKYIRIYNLNKIELEKGVLHINLIYNISKEKLEKPIYRNFEATKWVVSVNLDIVEGNLDFIFRRDRKYRIADPEKILRILEIGQSLKYEYGKAMVEIKEKIFKGRQISDSAALLVLSNDIVSGDIREMSTIKYRLNIDSNILYVSNLKLHTIESIDVAREESYDEMFEIILEADSLMERLLDLKRRKGEIVKKDIEITRELLDVLENSEETEIYSESGFFKSYHHYLTNDLNREKNSEIISYRGEKYEIIKVDGDGYLIVRYPERRILTDDRLIGRIVIKYKMLHGEMA